MQYRLMIAEHPVDVEARPGGGDGALEITVGERPYRVVFRALSANRLQLVVDGTAREVHLARTARGKEIFLCGRTYPVRDASRRRSRRGSGGDAPGEVTPPMPAVVVRLMVEEGQPVTQGQGLVVVSAMKMETTLVAPYAGRVKKIRAAEGAKVAPGDILVEIEPEGTQDGR